ncbi:MAG: hypothetical protein BAJALOKI1v1_2160003 [Promethearchaeota archaeon]|nr:MAG: hypothetical protein BAJALOKI1v1_2160003 [Candidatus Lokiarchaeota archaeon]
MDLQKVCFICGAPHSGSTLLGLILGSHSKCFYAGEANKVTFLHSKSSSEDSKCKMCGQNCSIWGDFTLKDPKDLYLQLSLKTQTPIIIDSTKKPTWLQEQINNLKREQITLTLIYLYRDGRAVINSRLRKYKDSEPAKVIDNWISHINKTNQLYNEFPGDKIKILYKNLAQNTIETIQTITKFLTISFEPSMIAFYEHEHHPLGGNTGTQSLILKSQQEKRINSPIQLSERNQYYYEDHPLQIKFDERWKTELDPKVLHLFDKKAGALNTTFLDEFKKQ